MKKIFSNKTNRGRVFALSLILIIIVLCIGAYGLNIKDNKPVDGKAKEVNGYISSSVSGRKETGDVESIIEYGKNYTIVVHYPVFKKPGIDSVIFGDVSKYVADFKNQVLTENSPEGYLHIDYEAYLVDSSYTSIDMSIESSLSIDANAMQKIKCYVFNNQNDSRISVGDIIETSKTSEFLKVVVEKVKGLEGYNSLVVKTDDIISYVSQNPHCFLLEKEGLKIKFEKYSIMPGSEGVQEITISYKEIESLFKSGVDVGTVTNHLDAANDGKSSVEIVPVQRNIDPNKPMVALTFDDGPHPEHTREILKSLSKHGGVATFYMLGNRASSYGDVVADVVRQGSEVGNHSWSHSNYTKKSAKEIKDDVQKSKSAIEKFSNSKNITLRVPYGALNDTVKSNADAPIVLWSVDTNDWKDKNSDIIIQRATENIKDGDIILMHDIWGETAHSVDEIAARLTEQGFQLVTVGEMAKARNVELKNGTKYFSFKK